MTVVPVRSSVPESVLLEAVRRGDEDAFRGLVEPYRTELHAHCYRMLGSVHDADDVLQDVLVRVWRALPRFEPGRPLRPWLYTITTNAGLSAITRRPRRQLPTDVGSPTGSGDGTGTRLPRSTWVEPYPDEQLGLQDRVQTPEARYEQREAVELAFIAALQHLPGRQRAVLVLRDVLAFSAREVALSLGTTVPAVNSALQRARKTIETRLPPRSQRDTLRSLGDDRTRALVERLVDAFEAGDIDAILALFADDVTFHAAVPRLVPRPRGCGPLLAHPQAADAGPAVRRDARQRAARARCLPAGQGERGVPADRSRRPHPGRHVHRCHHRLPSPNVFPSFGLLEAIRLPRAKARFS